MKVQGYNGEAYQMVDTAQLDVQLERDVGEDLILLALVLDLAAVHADGRDAYIDVADSLQGVSEDVTTEPSACSP